MCGTTRRTYPVALTCALTDDDGETPDNQWLCAEHANDLELVLSADYGRWVGIDATYFTEDTEQHFESNRNLFYNDGSGCWCENSQESEDDDDDDGGLRSYGTDILNVLSWPSVTPADSLCLGVELEMEPARGSRQSDLVAALEDVPGSILKEDGSLSAGVELVTLPYTLAYHRESFGWTTALARVHGIGKSGAGTSNCGMHVHVNRRALSPLTVGKVLVFLNASHNSAFVTKVAQRSNNSYARRDSGKKITDINGTSRYDLLNVSGSRTIEFRLFRGNLRAERVIKNLEFCVALIRFCENSGIKRAARFDAFLEYLAKHAKEYPALCTFLATVGYAVTDPQTISDAALALSDL
jgi:hypothetical protein